MIVSYNWLQEYFTEPLPQPKELGLLLNTRAFEVEGITSVADDFSIDIDVQPNRAHDCFSHQGIAKEIAVLTQRQYMPRTIEQQDRTVENPIKVICEEKDCTRYIATYMQDIVNTQHVEEFSKKLQTLGQRSINSIVDIANIVMFELGQPVHVFDADKIAGSTIIIRQAQVGEQLTTLDGNEVTFAGGELVIADMDGPLAIAGIKGGSRAAVTSETKHIVLEAAHFNASTIRKTSRELGISTDSSKRFERDVTPALAEQAMQLLIAYITNHCNTNQTSISQSTDVYPRPQGIYNTGVSLREVNEYLGLELSETKLEAVFTQLQFSYEKVIPHEHMVASVHALVGKPYVYGASVLFDAPNTFDCSSFIAYLHKEAGVSIPRVTVDQYIWGEAISKDELIPGDIIFCDVGASPVGEDKQFYHTATVDYMKGTPIPHKLDHNGIYIGDGKVAHASSKAGNAVVIEQLSESKIFSHIVGYRRMVVPGEARYVITVPVERLDLRIPQDIIEEVGRVYGYEHIAPVPLTHAGASQKNDIHAYLNTARAILATRGFSEIMTPTFVSVGDVAAQKAIASDKGFLRTTLLEGVKDALALNQKNIDLLGLDRVMVFEIGNTFTARGEKLCIALGVSGKKSQALLEDALVAIGLSGTIQEGVVEVEISQENLPTVEHLSLPRAEENIAYKAFSPYPYIVRDIAVWVPSSVLADTVQSYILEHAGPLLVVSRLFDVYEKEGRTSFAFRLVFQSFEKTLTDEEVAPFVDAITEMLRAQEGFEVR